MNQTAVPAPAPATAPRATMRSRRVSLLAMAALFVAIPVVAGVAALGWMYRTENASLTERRQGEVELAAKSVADVASIMIQAHSTSPLKMLPGEAMQRAGLTECFITTSKNEIVAHSDPKRVELHDLPEAWPSLPAAAAADDVLTPHPPPRTLEAREKIMLDDGAFAVVVARAAIPSATTTQTSLVTGMVAISLGVFGAGLLLGRRVLFTIRPLLAIQGALQAIGRGEQSLEALAISPRWGAEATAWNAFLAQREAEKAAALDRRVEQTAGAGRAGDAMLDRSCDALPQGLIVIEPTGRIRYANGAAGVLLGLSKADLIGKPVPQVITDEAAARMVHAVAVAGSRRRGSVELDRRVGDEGSVLRLTCCRAAGGSGGDGAGGTGGGGAPAPSVLFVEDLTQQRVADRSRDLFVSHATHELRTPLTNIRLYVETLLEGADADAAERGKCINVINQEVRRLERMVSDMLSVAEIEAGSMKLHTDDVRLEALFEALKVDYAAQAADKNVSLVWDLPPKFPVIRGDRDKITMSLHNLIGNALKYTPTSGTVTVTAEETPGLFAVRVKDTGIGIAPDEAEQIFEKFYRSKDRRVAKIPGTGLGLSIAREVIRLHGGDITVDSQVDHGSTFTLTLPHLAQAA